MQHASCKIQKTHIVYLRHKYNRNYNFVSKIKFCFSQENARKKQFLSTYITLTSANFTLFFQTSENRFIHSITTCIFTQYNTDVYKRQILSRTLSYQCCFFTGDLPNGFHVYHLLVYRLAILVLQMHLQHVPGNLTMTHAKVKFEVRFNLYFVTQCYIYIYVVYLHDVYL